MSYSGYLIVFDEENRPNELIEYIQNGWPFSDALSATEWQFNGKEFCFLSFDNKTISYAALALRKKKVATRKFKVEFSDYIKIPPISFEQLEIGIRNRIRQYVIKVTSNNGERIPPTIWKEIISTIKELRPEVSNDLDELELKRLAHYKDYSGAGYEIVAQEKDAVDLAFKIFSPNRATPKLLWTDQVSKSELAPFLNGITKPLVTEDLMIIHDSNIFGDWHFLNRFKMGVVMFESGDKKLTIVNCNRTKIENNLGVDLLYYHHLFGSYVLVQYKKLVRDDHYHHLHYRPKGISYLNEIDRMKSFLADHPLQTCYDRLVDFRLLSNGFFFKLCEVEDFIPEDQELIKGMYIPFDYWITLLQTDNVLGPRGGISINYDNVGRYLNNTLFIELVANGWIGSSKSSSREIEKIVNQSLDEGKSIMVAYSEQT